MCGRFTLHHAADAIAERFAAEVEMEIAPRYNVAPTQGVLTILGGDGGCTGQPMRWGLVPSWAKDIGVGARMINARAETLAEKPSFRGALAGRRCVIPADGFYEWREADNPDEGGKTPMYVRRRDGELFGFAGLWDEWHSGEGAAVRSCAIVTGPPNGLMASIHDRMPMILRRDDEAVWLDGGVRQAGVLLSLLSPYAEGEMEAYAVSRRVNRPSVDDAGCIARV